MRQQRTRVVINVGNLLELAGAGCAVYGLDRILGLGWALILAGILLVAAAELIYDQHAWRIPLPRLPQIRLRVAERKDYARAWWIRRRARYIRWQARRANR